MESTNQRSSTDSQKDHPSESRASIGQAPLSYESRGAIGCNAADSRAPIGHAGSDVGQMAGGAIGGVAGSGIGYGGVSGSGGDRGVYAPHKMSPRRTLTAASSSGSGEWEIQILALR